MTSRYSDDRLSLAQEIAPLLRSRGLWVPKDWAGPDLITAIGLAMQELDGLRQRTADMTRALETAMQLLDDADRYSRKEGMCSSVWCNENHHDSACEGDYLATRCIESLKATISPHPQPQQEPKP